MPCLYKRILEENSFFEEKKQIKSRYLKNMSLERLSNGFSFQICMTISLVELIHFHLLMYVI